MIGTSFSSKVNAKARFWGWTLGGNRRLTSYMQVAENANFPSGGNAHLQPYEVHYDCFASSRDVFGGFRRENSGIISEQRRLPFQPTPTVDFLWLCRYTNISRFLTTRTPDDLKSLSHHFDGTHWYLPSDAKCHFVIECQILQCLFEPIFIWSWWLFVSAKTATCNDEIHRLHYYSLLHPAKILSLAMSVRNTKSSTYGHTSIAK